MSDVLSELTATVAETSPELADEWEAAALVESFGYTDQAVQQSLGFANTRALGQHVYERVMATPSVRRSEDERPLDLRARIRHEAAIFIRVLSSSLVYSIPWIVVFFFQYMHREALAIDARVAGPITVAPMVSLITSGGFIQGIARKGDYYLALNQPVLARATCWLLWRWGLAVTLVVALAAFLTGLYFHIFDRGPLLIALVYYVALSILWMTCALLTLRQRHWRIPLVFLVAGIVFALARISFGLSTLAAQSFAVAAALVAAGIFAMFVFDRNQARESDRHHDLTLPQAPVFVYSLAPYFCYGAAYFSFLFADRIAAGSAVPLLTGLQFSLQPTYQAAMDAALLAFLLIAAFVEYCNFTYMHFWHTEARRRGPQEFAELTSRLRRRRLYLAAAICVLLALIAVIEWIVLYRAKPELLGTTGLWVFVLGVVGYALFSLALFDALMLFSLNQARRVVRALAPALILNLLVGYILSHALAVPYAVVGLLLGGIWFAVDARRGVRKSLGHAEYAYYAV